MKFFVIELTQRGWRTAKSYNTFWIVWFLCTTWQHAPHPHPFPTAKVTCMLVHFTLVSQIQPEDGDGRGIW